MPRYLTRLVALLATGLLCAAPLAAAQADEPPAAELQPVMVVMDYSSSMLAKDADGKGTTRIDAAKKAAKHLINNAPQDASMGLVVYGSKTPKKCDDITTVQKPGPVDKKELAGKLDGLTTGLRRSFQAEFRRTPGVLRRLRRTEAVYAGIFREHDAILSPVLAHTAPPIGHLSPNVAFDELVDRLLRYVAFTPVNNVTGGPGISLPAGAAPSGLPIGVHLSAAHGQERVLLELAYALEADRPWRRIQD